MKRCYVVEITVALFLNKCRPLLIYDAFCFFNSGHEEYLSFETFLFASFGDGAFRIRCTDTTTSVRENILRERPYFWTTVAD